MSLIHKLDSSNLLQRILAEPDLPEKIRSLKTHELVGLINQVGLEDCAEVIGCASLEQLEQVLDDDLWQANTPGGDENFDAGRFGVWLEVLLELGSEQAAERISNMDPDFLVGAISQLIWVAELDWLERQASDDHRIEKVLDSTNYFEVEEFVIFARQPESWDAVVTIITELDQRQHSFIRNILERCAGFFEEEIEDSHELYRVLTSEQQLMSDIAAEREERRRSKGYVPPHEARAFLKLASLSLETEDNVSPKRLRASNSGSARPIKNQPLQADNQPGLIQVDARFFKVRSFIMSDKTLESIRMEQLVYLANVLVAGADNQGRRIRPGEAIQLALETCEKGLGLRPESKSLLEAFRAAWSVRNST